MLLPVVVCPNILARDLSRTKTGHSANTLEVNIFSVRSSLAFGKQNHQHFGICSTEEIQLKVNSKSCHCSKREGGDRQML